MMWGTGVIVALVIITQYAYAEDTKEFTSELIERIKRSPYTPLPCYPPGPPPPPYWRQPPTPHWPSPPHWHQHWPQPPPPEWYRDREQDYKQNPGYPVPKSKDNVKEEDKPCSTCDDEQNSAISNAKSESGSAVAIAIAKANKT